MTISYGHGMAVTPLHLATAASAIINGGILHRPTLLKMPAGEEARRASAWSRRRPARKCARLMRLVVEEGTGRQAEVPGYMVGGKTGSAEKPGKSGGYQLTALVSSFVGAFPMDNPRYVVLATIDEPHGTPSTYGYRTAGWNAAPVVGHVDRSASPRCSTCRPERGYRLGAGGRRSSPRLFRGTGERMRLSDLIQENHAASAIEILGLSADSRAVQPGYLFAALSGTEQDGAAYIDSAIEHGAVAVLTAPDVSVPSKAVHVVADNNPRRRLALLAARFYAAQPRMIAAVTGTNGKTSVAWFVRQIWEILGYKAASIGTLGAIASGFPEQPSLTTPEPVTLHHTLSRIRGSGDRSCGDWRRRATGWRSTGWTVSGSRRRPSPI